MTRTSKANIAAADHAGLGGARRASRPFPLLSSPPLRSAARADARPSDATARPSSRTDRSPRASPSSPPTPQANSARCSERYGPANTPRSRCVRSLRPRATPHPYRPPHLPRTAERRRAQPFLWTTLATRSPFVPGRILTRPTPPVALLSPHLSPTNCCAPCGPWCPPSRATSSRMRTSSPGFSSSGCARSLFEAPNSPPRVINPRGSSPAVANTARGVT